MSGLRGTAPFTTGRAYGPERPPRAADRRPREVGMYIALRLLRDGAHTTITTRFPNDAVRRFTAMADSADWRTG